jgi:predicted MFS family arabinose efflux permease
MVRSPLPPSSAVESASPGAPVPVALLAVSAGVIVANLYYNQPLLALMAGSFGVSEEAVGSIPTVTQLGYGAAMLLLVPLGDRYERRSLIVLMTCASALALLLVAFAPSLPMLAAASLLLGTTSMVPQYVVPYAAAAAAPHERGRVVGSVMGGLLIGILLSRTVSGVVGERFGWRVMYIAAAVVMVVTAVVLRARLPRQAPEQKVPLRALYTSILRIVREEPVVRLHAVLGGLAFASFSVFWSTLAFQIAGPPFHYGSSVVGAFGVVGVVGAIAAPLVGRFADTRDSRIVNAMALLVCLLSFGVFAAFGSSLVGLGVGVVLMDLGVQANHISNQTRIFSLNPAMRNRLNTVYMSTYFAGGALGSAIGAFSWHVARWPAVCFAGAALNATALVVFYFARRVVPRAATAS